MNYQSMSFSLPDYMVKKLKKEKNRSKIVQQALDAYFAKQLREQAFKQMSWSEQLEYVRKKIEAQNLPKWSVEKIIEMKNKGRM